MGRNQYFHLTSFTDPKYNHQAPIKSSTIVIVEDFKWVLSIYLCRTVPLNTTNIAVKFIIITITRIITLHKIQIVHEILKVTPTHTVPKIINKLIIHPRTSVKIAYRCYAIPVHTKN